MTGIVQVVQVNKTNDFRTTTGGSWVDVTGLTVDITPSSASNKIIAFVKLNIGSDGSSGVAYKLVRNGSDVDVGAAASNRKQATGSAFGTQLAVDSGVTVVEAYLDSPASVATQTYKIQVWRGASASVTVNKGETDTDSANFYRTSSNIVLMEFEP